MVDIVTPDLPVYKDRKLSEFAAPGQSVLGAMAGEAFHDLPVVQASRDITLDEADNGRRISRWGGRYEPDSPLLDQSTASSRAKDAGLEGQLEIPETGIRERSLNLLIENRKEVNRRNAIISRSPGGITMGAAGLATQLGVSLLDPTNVAMSFVPVVGEARYAQMLARAGSTLGRVGVRAGVGAAEGVVGQAILEPLTYATDKRYQEEYGLNDALTNIAFGGLFGAAVHNIAPAARGAMRLARGRDTTVQTAALSEALAAHLEDRPPRVSELLAAVEKINARQEALRSGTSLSPVGRIGLPDEAFVIRNEAPAQIVSGMGAQADAGRPPIMDPRDGVFTSLSPVRQAIESDWALANSLSVVDDIERLSANGQTASEIVSSLGARLDAVNELAAANGEAHFSRANKLNLVRSVRSKLDIPSADDRVEFARWRQEYLVRQATPRPGTTDAASTPQSARPNPEPGSGQGSVRSAFDQAFDDANPLETVLKRIRDDRLAIPEDESAALTQIQELAKGFDSGNPVEAQLAEIESFAAATEDLINLERQAGRITPDMDAALKDSAQAVSDAEKRGDGFRQAAFCIGRARA